MLSFIQVAMTTLHARAVTVRFGGLTAVNDVTVALSEGEVLGLIGPNGAGKTTLVNVLSGFQVPAAGTIAVGKRDCTRLPPPTISPRRGWCAPSRRCGSSRG